MAKKLDWINNKGEVVFKGSNAFGPAARRVWDERWGGGESHIRAGRFSCVISPDMGWDNQGHSLSEIVIAQSYDEPEVEGDGSILPGSKYWESNKSNRLTCLGKILSQFWSTHALYAEVMKDIEAELLYLLTAKD